MTPTVKIIIGALVTSALAYGAYGPMGMGQHFIDGLTTKSEAALGAGGINGVTVAFDSAPALQRSAVLSGPITDPAAREAALAAVRAIPGVASARWADDGGAAAAPAAAPATAAQVASCQTDVDTAIKGKTIQFASGKADITPESMALVATLAKALDSRPAVNLDVPLTVDVGIGENWKDAKG